MSAVIYIHITYTQWAPRRIRQSFNDKLDTKNALKQKTAALFIFFVCSFAKFNIMCPPTLSECLTQSGPRLMSTPSHLWQLGSC